MALMILLTVWLALCAKFGAWHLFAFTVLVGVIKIVDMHYTNLLNRSE